MALAEKEQAPWPPRQDMGAANFELMDIGVALARGERAAALEEAVSSSEPDCVVLILQPIMKGDIPSAGFSRLFLLVCVPTGVSTSISRGVLVGHEFVGVASLIRAAGGLPEGVLSKFTARWSRFTGGCGQMTVRHVVVMALAGVQTGVPTGVETVLESCCGGRSSVNCWALAARGTARGLAKGAATT